jgi:heat shock protein HslJ
MMATCALALAACPGVGHKDQPAAADAPAAMPPADSGVTSSPGDSAVALEGTEWALIELGGQPVVAERERRPGFRLVADGRKVQGNAGCNRMMGSYRADGASLKFGPLASNKMACPAMETETKFLSALGATTRYEIAGSTLTLFGGARRSRGSRLPARRARAGDLAHRSRETRAAMVGPSR